MDGARFDALTRNLARGQSRRSLLRGLIGGGAALAATKAGGVVAQPDSTITICHFPAGNAGNVQVIDVNSNSLNAHLAHGDFEFSGCCFDSDCPPFLGQCGESFCNAGTCDARPTPGAECDDGVDCTTGVDRCTDVVGECNGEPNHGFCDDGNVCTDNACDPITGPLPSGCRTRNNTDPCDDGDACTVGDVCQDGQCVGSPRDCDDGNVCTTDSCSGGVCSNTFDCTLSDLCCAGECEECDTTTGECVDRDSLCTDPCLEGQSCSDGNCVGGTETDCSDSSDDCNSGVCNPTNGACEQNPVNNDGNCDLDGGGTGICSQGQCICRSIDAGCESDGDCCGDQDGEHAWCKFVAFVGSRCGAPCPLDKRCGVGLTNACCTDGEVCGGAIPGTCIQA